MNIDAGPYVVCDDWECIWNKSSECYSPCALSLVMTLGGQVICANQEHEEPEEDA